MGGLHKSRGREQTVWRMESWVEELKAAIHGIDAIYTTDLKALVQAETKIRGKSDFH
jgi:predicted lipoprotein